MPPLLGDGGSRLRREQAAARPLLSGLRRVSLPVYKRYLFAFGKSSGFLGSVLCPTGLYEGVFSVTAALKS